MKFRTRNRRLNRTSESVKEWLRKGDMIKKERNRQTNRVKKKKKRLSKIECLSVLFFRKRRRLGSEIEGSFNGGEKGSLFGH